MSNPVPGFEKIPLFQLTKKDPTCVSLFGKNPHRVYPDEAPQNVTGTYAVWTIDGGNPESTLSCRPDMDQFFTSVEIYASSRSLARQAAQAIIGAIEGQCYVTLGSLGKEAGKRSYRVNISADWRICR